MLAPIGTQVQLRCSVIQGYGVRWLVTTSGGSPRSTAAVDAVTQLGSLGISFKPLSITAQESVLTVNGTEGNNGTTVECFTVLLTGTEDMDCSSGEILMIFYGMHMNMLLISHGFVTCLYSYLQQVLPHHQLT